eukprot:s148_g23.t1
MKPPFFLAWLQRLLLQMSLQFLLAWLPLQLLQMSLQFVLAWLQFLLAWLQLQLLDESAVLPGPGTATASAKESAVFPGLATPTAPADMSHAGREAWLQRLYGWRGALVAAGLDGVSSNGDLVQLTQLPARLCMPGRALVPADEAGAAGGAAGREAWSRAIMRNAFFSSITFSRNTPSCRGRFGLNCIAAVHLREYLENG